MSTLTISGLEALLQKLGLEVPIPSFDESDVLNKPLDIAHCYLSGILSNLAGCDAAAAYGAVTGQSNTYNGDLAVVVPKLSHGRKPKEVGFELMEKFPQDHPLFLFPFPDGVQLRVLCKEETFPRICIPYIIDRADTYGRDISFGRRDSLAQDLARKRIIVEFSNPNIASEFHGKHLRSTILGAFIANVHEAMGWDVVRMNYLGDWGKPVGLLGVGWEKFGSEEAFEADPLGHLMQVYHQIHELFAPELAAIKNARGDEQAELENQGISGERNAFFKRMEDGDERALALATRVRGVNVENYVQVYARLGVKFDEYSGESKVVGSEMMAEVEEILKSKGLLCEEGDGLLTIDLKKYKLGAGVKIRDHSGSTYLLRDLAAALERDKKHSFQKMIYVVAGEQTVHFSRVKKILELMDKSELASRLQHISFNEASHMFDKLGDQNHTLGDILDRCQVAMAESLEVNKEKAGNLRGTEPPVGISALLAQELCTKRAHEHTFDLDHMTSFENGTGPSMRWWLTRLNEVVATASDPGEVTEEDWESIEGEDEVNLLRLLVQWPEIVQSAYKSLEPMTIMGYLANVTSQLSVCFQNLEEGEAPTGARRMLFHSARVVLQAGLVLSGVSARKL